MHRKIDIGVDKNLFIVDPKAAKTPQLKFLEDDIPKNPDEAVTEARKLAASNWINSDPVIFAHSDDAGRAYLFFIAENLKRKVIVFFIWDYTLLPCRRALTYVQEWHKRYGHSGLLVIGIHSPMFEFAKDRKNISDAIRELSVTFPVVLDNDFNIWKSLENRFWPRILLLDSEGKFHQDVTGEGHYAELETNIQLMLREISPGLPCPPVLKPSRKVDDQKYTVPETSGEMYFGMKKRTPLGNKQFFHSETEEAVFPEVAVESIGIDTPYLEGGWKATSESIYGTANKALPKIHLKFTGTEIYIVARCRPKHPLDAPSTFKLQFIVDHKPLTQDNLGVHGTYNEIRRTVVQLKDAKLYHIVTGLDHGPHELTLILDEDPVQTAEIYALFFEHKA